MATKKAAATKSATKAAAATKGATKATTAKGGVQIAASDRVKFDSATKEIQAAVARAIKQQPLSLTTLKDPIIFGIRYDPRTKKFEVIKGQQF